MRNVEQAVASIEGCDTIDSLKATLQKIIEDRGFMSFAFLDMSVPGIDDPLVIDTHREAWLREYRSNRFVHVDPMLPVARRTNTPFDWDSVSVPRHAGGRKSGAVKTMEAARDHGFTNGLVIPFHYIDGLGRQYSSVCTFFWSDRPKRFVTMLRQERFALHVILLYWAQRAVDISAKARHKPSRFLDAAGLPMMRGTITDRERDVLSWAGRGKSQEDTAAILRLSANTVETHVRNAIEKLGANNKTHAVAKAIYFGLIDV